MKIVALLPVKNEDWILPTTLKPLCEISDHIIAADQFSTDNTKTILSNEEKVTIIQNEEIVHSNKVRWRLLDESRKLFGENNIIINLDADEIIPPKLFYKKLKQIQQYPAGTLFSAQWTQLWRSINMYRSDDGVWNPKKNRKIFLFRDNGKQQYSNEFILNDHTSRVPTINTGKIINLNIPLIHFQFVNWDRSQIKQVWYKCSEKINGIDPKKINEKYYHSTNENNLQLSKTKSKWFKNLEVNKSIENSLIIETWYYKEIKDMFLKHGKDEFRELDIWSNKYVQELSNSLGI